LGIPGQAVPLAGLNAFAKREGTMRKTLWSSLLVVALMSMPAAAEERACVCV